MLGTPCFGLVAHLAENLGMSHETVNFSLVHSCETKPLHTNRFGK
jgi:hypothetical protein